MPNATPAGQAGNLPPKRGRHRLIQPSYLPPQKAWPPLPPGYRSPTLSASPPAASSSSQPVLSPPQPVPGAKPRKKRRLRLPRERKRRRGAIFTLDVVKWLGLKVARGMTMQQACWLHKPTLKLDSLMQALAESPDLQQAFDAARVAWLDKTLAKLEKSDSGRRFLLRTRWAEQFILSTAVAVSGEALPGNTIPAHLLERSRALARERCLGSGPQLLGPPSPPPVAIPGNCAPELPVPVAGPAPLPPGNDNIQTALDISAEIVPEPALQQS